MAIAVRQLRLVGRARVGLDLVEAGVVQDGGDFLVVAPASASRRSAALRRPREVWPSTVGAAALAALAADPAANLSELFKDLLLSGVFTRIETGAPQ